ncbi:MAG TPA: DUF362 domain-containing protein [Bryobacteraceae bacterium]|nr:DUF362 domain-containing protein [Bryobacteraceae bacterium]
MPFPRLALPHMAHIRRNLPSQRVPDPRHEVRCQLLDLGLREKIRPGARIAITAGSRGMGGFLELLSGIVDAVKEAGGQPFLVPAMGSHGGAVAEGQTEILRLLGATEEAVGAPICASMDTYVLGKAKNGAVAHLDTCAAEADGIIVFGRTKTHPESAEKLASGLLKMTVIGLGKQRGAQEAHSHKLWDSVRQVSEITMAKSKIIFGVAVVENPYRQPMVIEVVEPTYDAFRKSDERLLELARYNLPRLPFNKMDLLVVDEVGKTISGSGMDLNVIGHERATGVKKRGEPDINRIAALSLTKPSLGNGLGIGLADFTTRRFMDEYDPAATYINLLTATEPDSTTHEGPLPLALDSDREAIEVALYSALPKSVPRVCRIRDTASLEEMWVSEPLLKELGDGFIVQESLRELPYDANGNLF